MSNKKLLIIVLFFLMNSFSCESQPKIKGKIKEYYLSMNKYAKNKDNEYYQYFRKILHYPDSIQAREIILYLIFNKQDFDETLLFWLQDDSKRLGFYEDWDVLDRFYKRYQERYRREAVSKDSSLIPEHQAYIQFLAVCNYEKIKPLYLQELSEMIRSGDYTYAFNSYLLPEHWEEAADTLMKYYWEVKDEDTKEKMNKAIVTIKKEKGYEFYKRVCQEEKNPILIKMMMAAIYGEDLQYKNQSMYQHLKQFIKDKSLRRFFHVGE